MKQKIGLIGVDAGLCWIGDPCYVLHQERLPKALGKNWEDFCKKLSDGPSTQFGYDLGHPGLGVCVSTGFGDGRYPVFADIDEHGTVHRVWVDFMAGPDGERQKGERHGLGTWF